MQKLLQASSEYNPSKGPQCITIHQTRITVLSPHLRQGLAVLLPDCLVIEKGGRGCRAHLTLGQVLGGVDKEAGHGVEEELVWCRC